MYVITKRKILIMGLPGSGKTTLANPMKIAWRQYGLIRDAVRTEIHKDLGFSEDG